MQPNEGWSRDNSTLATRAAASSAARPPDASEGSTPLPSIQLPKGGGAIRGMGEKFASNPVTGSGSLTVPIYTSPGRSGFGPQLSLSYDSGSGNGPFGFGWSLALPAITRKTDKGLPRYEDFRDSDVFILSGAEDLVPALTQAAGDWTPDVVTSRTVYANDYAIHRYRPRVEGLFARIERWVNLSDPADTFWRSISRDNVTTWYGRTAESRIADPADSSRIFSWLICESYDDKGNVAAYSYKAENSDAVDLTQAHERNRTTDTRRSRRYLKHVYYGNRTPYFPDLNAAAPVALPADWCFELVFDYGEHDPLNPVPGDSGHLWDCRLDPFSTYRSTFEVRTYRLCRRTLMFHHFPAEANVGADCLVRSTDFTYSTPPADLSQPFYSFLVAAAQSGYSRNGAAGYISNSLPPLEFEYTAAALDETVRTVDPSSLENLPYGLDGSNYRWADLDGEGLSGILTEQGGSWFYKANLSPVNQQILDTGEVTLPRFAPTRLVARRPSLADLGKGRQQLLDLSGDGRLDLVDFESATPGFYERTPDGDWEPFAEFRSMPVLDWRNPNLKFIDLTGDGFADLLISEDQAFAWHESLSAEGFGPGRRTLQAFDEEEGPKLVFADGTESIFLADLSGDGLTDLVRVRNGEVCFWPNLGYGRFGAKVTMDGSPWFDRSDVFDGLRIRLADIDGSGTADLIYFAGDGVDLYFNQSGNGWGARRSLSHFPQVENLSSATALDLLGNGTACLVWSSPLAAGARRQMRYIDLMSAGKPHLLVRARNNLGAETVVEYAPSTKFYVADKLAGTPWVTRLPFPVHVVERVSTYDYVGRNLFVTRYAYHHGYFDGIEREFRGFGRVDQFDTEEYAALAGQTTFPQPVSVEAASHVPPVCTITWYHTGAFFGAAGISKHFEHEYYSEGDAAGAAGGLTAAQLESMLLDDTVAPTDILLPDGKRLQYGLSGEELRQACRALRGSILRREVYALDGSEAAGRPYTVSERNYTLETLQPLGPNPFAVFFAHARETVDFHYERKLYQVSGASLAAPGAPPPTTTAADPRVTHALTFAVDPFGNVLQAAAVAYGRRYLDPDLSPADQEKQRAILRTYTDSTYTQPPPSDDAYRAPLAAQSSTYELLQVAPAAAQPGVTNLFDFDELQKQIEAAADGQHDIPYEDLTPDLKQGERYRRLITRNRTYYRPDDMGAAAGDPRALLALGISEPLALPGDTYQLAFTPGLIAQVYQRGGAPLVAAPAAFLGSVGTAGGGYVDLDGDGNWWAPSGRVFYLASAPASPQEKDEALQHFRLPRRFEDAFGNAGTVDYDPHDLLMVQSIDAAGNVVEAANDYRVLAAALITDPNGNRTAVNFDVFGLVAGTAVMGKATESLGDLLTGVTADLAQSQVDDFYDADDPRTLAAGLLGNATTRVVYDAHRFFNSRQAAPTDPTLWEPVFAATLSRETHFFALPAGQQSRIRIAFQYSDGQARAIQSKIQAEPGPATDGGPVLDPRWVGSGWTILNNKGKPVRQYEPFFSQLPAKRHQFEFGIAAGVSPIICYDPVERAVATLHPNHTYDKVAFDPWHQTSSDGNDTVLELDPGADVDVGGYFRRLPAADYLPTWYTERAGGGLGAMEQDAAAKTTAHAVTPTVAYFDTLGRTFLTIADNAADGAYATRAELDIQGNHRSAIDPLGRKAMASDFDLRGTRIHQASMEAGERWMLHDASGKLIRAFDSRGHNLRTEYDSLRRPVRLFVLGTDPARSDPRTTAGEVLVEKTDYGEGVANDTMLNLRTRVFEQHDGAGLTINMDTDPATGLDIAYDFKGNLLRSRRQFVNDHKALPDWAGAAPLFSGDTFRNIMAYDALNRVTSTITPDGSVVRPTYNEANLLEAIDVNLGGAAAATSFVTNLDYNAKGQRVLIEYGNGTSTAYTYDPLTFRLARLTTSRAGVPADQQVVQDLSYTYDPAGNITHTQDDADIHNVVFFSNRRVEPSSDYTYDAIYRLILASGREQLGLGGGQPLAPAAASYNDVPRIHLPHPGDGNAMGTYREQYQYDAVGNFVTFTHAGSNPANPGWQRSYQYTEASLLEPASPSNRLSRTTVNGAAPFVEDYSHDAHGSMTRMPHLQLIEWSWKDQLYMTQRQAVNASDGDGVLHQGERTYYVYDASGQRVRKTTESAAGVKVKERFYLGGFERYREYDGAGNVTLERDTLHLVAGPRRIALVETAGGASAIRFQYDNHLGTACLELDDLGAVISYEEYYPYGSTSYQAGRSFAEVSLKRYRYVGRERDEESGLHYHRARYYASWLGRWTAADGAGFVDGTNLYASTRCNPINGIDPNGEQDQPPPDATTTKISPQTSKLIHQAAEKAITREPHFREHIPFAPAAPKAEGPPTAEEIERLRKMVGPIMPPYTLQSPTKTDFHFRTDVTLPPDLSLRAPVGPLGAALPSQPGSPPPLSPTVPPGSPLPSGPAVGPAHPNPTPDVKYPDVYGLTDVNAWRINNPVAPLSDPTPGGAAPEAVLRTKIGDDKNPVLNYVRDPLAFIGVATTVIGGFAAGYTRAHPDPEAAQVGSTALGMGTNILAGGLSEKLLPKGFTISLKIDPFGAAPSTATPSPLLGAPAPFSLSGVKSYYGGLSGTF